jgi:phenylpropionate dioxygenase-like ring-hydroxylating dioxygenase large terminal subunit
LGEPVTGRRHQVDSDDRDPSGGDAAPLREAWYYAFPSRRLRPGRVLAKTMLGEPVLIGRSHDGTAFALRDSCPHRGIKLSNGRFDGSEIACAYHGWRFTPSGTCTAIPSLAGGRTVDLARIKVPNYPLREVNGNLWVYFGTDPRGAPPIPVIEAFGEGAAPDIARSVRLAAGYDHAVIGLMDPGHVPFVHRSWWYRSSRNLAEKEKAFAPSPHGFTMMRHPTSGNSRAYKLLGATARETDIVFTLPGVRIEHTRAGRHAIVNMTAMTPLDDGVVEMNHCIYWTMPWLTALRPVLHPFVGHFLGQDRAALSRQQEGLKYDPPLMLVGDADMQARWYYRLKREYARARAAGRAFVNPVGERVLRWRS